MTSAPARAIARAALMPVSLSGNPAGRDPTSPARLSAAALANAVVTALVLIASDSEPGGRRGHVLVAAAGQVDQDQAVRAELAAQQHRAGQRVRGLDGRDDALGAAQRREALHRVGVG